MFTIKVLRRNSAGHERTHMYQTESVTIHGPETGFCQPGERCVVFLEHSTGDHPAVTVSNEKPKDEDHWPCSRVIIENSNGQTSEIVDAPRLESAA